MADTPGRIAPIPLNTAYRTLFTVPTATLRLISEIVVANADGQQRSIKMSHVTSDNTNPDVSNSFMWDTPLKAGQVLGMGRGWVFAAGDSLQALADESAVVVVTVYYIDRAV